MQTNPASKITLAILTAFALSSTLPALAEAPPAGVSKINKHQGGYHHFKIGSIGVTALSDGTVTLTPQDILTNTKPGQVKARLAEHLHGDTIDISVNAYLIETQGRLLLVDAGAGDLFGPTLNKLPASLKGAGYKAEDITDILITHIHTDHTGGLTDGVRRVFPNATLHLEQRELDYWMSAANRDKAVGGAKKNFADAEAKIKPYLDAGKVKPFHGATVLFPGIRAIPSPGHTPGHSFYSVENGGEKLVFWGDLLHIAEVQLPNPEVTISFDIDSPAAAVQRQKAFADAARGKYLIAAYHIAFPGLGRLRAEGKGYRWVPAPYLNDNSSHSSR